jgi:hypothetical protein
MNWLVDSWTLCSLSSRTVWLKLGFLGSLFGVARETLRKLDTETRTISTTLTLTRSDFMLDSRNDRILDYDIRLDRLVCFDFEGDSFEFSMTVLRKIELVDYDYQRFEFIDKDSLVLVF